MILYGCAVTDGETFARFAEAGIRRADRRRARLGALWRSRAPARSRATTTCSAPAPRSARTWRRWCSCTRTSRSPIPGSPRWSARRSPTESVAIAGCAGAIGVRSLAWWEGSVTWASVTQRYEEFGGGGEIPGISWRPEDKRGYVGTGEVDAIDGCLIVLSPWAVRNLSFDEQLARRHGYDVDICLQARAAGRKVVTADLRMGSSPTFTARPAARRRRVRPGARARSPRSGRGCSTAAGERATGAGGRSTPRPRPPPTACGWVPRSCSETTPAAS